MRGGDTAGEKKKYHDALHTQVAYKHEKNIQRRKDDQVLVAVEVVAVDVASVFVNVVDIDIAATSFIISRKYSRNWYSLPFDVVGVVVVVNVVDASVTIMYLLLMLLQLVSLSVKNILRTGTRCLLMLLLLLMLLMLASRSGTCCCFGFFC